MMNPDKRIFNTTKAFKVAELVLRSHSLAFKGDIIGVCHTQLQLHKVIHYTFQEYQEKGDIEPMIGPDIPPLPCIYIDECEICDGVCDDYKWREESWTPYRET